MFRYYMFNKPRGCITARSDPRHKTVMDYFPEEERNVLFPVGRLDKDTEGFLLITDDGNLCYDLMKPEKKVAKTYFFWALGELGEEKIRELEQGVEIYRNKGIVTAPAKLTVIKRAALKDISDLLGFEDLKLSVRRGELPVISGNITITEGKKHQVKRMLKYAGCKVVYLKRLSIGNLELDSEIKSGCYRLISKTEIEKLKMNI